MHKLIQNLNIQDLLTFASVNKDTRDHVKNYFAFIQSNQQKLILMTKQDGQDVPCFKSGDLIVLLESEVDGVSELNVQKSVTSECNDQNIKAIMITIQKYIEFCYGSVEYKKQSFEGMHLCNLSKISLPLK